MFKRGYNNYFLLPMFVLILTACSENSGNSPETQQTEKKSGAINVPTKIITAALPATGTLNASIFVDGSATATSSKTVALSDTDVSFSLGGVTAGDHTFTIVFEYADTEFGDTYELARATSATVNVTAGSSSTVDFLDSDYTYADDDNDGLTNLAELDESVRTDPSDKTCIFDSSKFDLCTMGA